MITPSLTEILKKLRLTGMLESYEVRLTEARENALYQFPIKGTSIMV